MRVLARLGHSRLQEGHHRSMLAAMDAAPRHEPKAFQYPVRKSVPVSEADLELVTAIRSPNSAERAAAQLLVGDLPQTLSGAQTLNMLVSLGAARIRETVASESTPAGEPSEGQDRQEEPATGEPVERTSAVIRPAETEPADTEREGF